MSENNLKEKLIIRCPNCGQKLRIPKVSRVLKVRCRSCAALFIYPTQSRLKKNYSWFFVRIKSHPILFGLLVTLWLFLVGTMYKLETISIKGSLYITVLCVGFWFLGSWVIESFKEKDIKWFYRKWFVLFMLFLIPPLGITLLWAGSKFKKSIKLTFTAIFGLWFISGVLTRTTGRFHFSPEDEIASLIKAPKENIFINPASNFVKTSFQDEILSKQIPSKRENLTIPQIAQVWGDYSRHV